jgi:SAM-dependent methyltransferase
MHPEVEQFTEMVKDQFPEKFINQDVFEGGSWDINGSLRKYFKGGTYHGIDLHEGDGVDQVARIHEFLVGKKYDVIVCSEALEHDRHWSASWYAMAMALRPGGLLIMTCAGPDRKEHGTHKVGPNLSPSTNDYYENRTLDDFPIPKKAIWKHCEYVRGKKDVNIAFII